MLPRTIAAEGTGTSGVPSLIAIGTTSPKTALSSCSTKSASLLYIGRGVASSAPIFKGDDIMVSDRIQYAIEQFKKNDIEFILKNESNGHFHCRRKTDDRLFQFWAGTGTILGYPNLKGIHALIHLLKGGD